MIDKEFKLTRDLVKLYVDTDNLVGKKIIHELQEANIPYTIFPTEGSQPLLRYTHLLGSYDDVSEIREFIQAYKEGTFPFDEEN